MGMDTKGPSQLPSYSHRLHQNIAHTRSLNVTKSCSISVRARHIRTPIATAFEVYRILTKRTARRRYMTILCLIVVGFTWACVFLTRRYSGEEKSWPTFQGMDSSTLVFARSDLQKIWQWEIASGHYPSHRSSMLSSQVLLVYFDKYMIRI